MPSKPKPIDLSAGVIEQTPKIDLSAGLDDSTVQQGTTVSDDRNSLQRDFDAETEFKPLDFSSLENAVDSTLGNFGAGALRIEYPIFHPIKFAQGVGDIVAPDLNPQSIEHVIAPSSFAEPKPEPSLLARQPGETFGGYVARQFDKRPDESWGDYARREGGNLIGTAGSLLGGWEGTEAEPGAEELFSRIPSQSRAAQTFNDIERQAADVPVTMDSTLPAMRKFRQTVETGGKNSPTLRLLNNRINPSTPRLIQAAEDRGPVMFPEARGFYSNLTKETAPPGFLRRAIESSRNPPFRFNAGQVREAMNQDLTDAAGTIGRGEDYANAMREYVNAARLRKVLKGAAILGGAELLRRTGIPGQIAGHAARLTTTQ